MRYQSASEHPTYTYLDQHWPIQTEFTDSGKPIKLLIKKQFAPLAKKVYNAYKRGSEIYAVLNEWTNLTDKLQLPKIPEVTVEFGGIAVFIVRVLISAVVWAVKHGVELSRFKLHTGGSMGEGGIGWTPMGEVIYREC
ncbi:hypothetical protein [Haloplanus salinarum]|uniref:hypothetical protein n=1 Tax=Haloplanus salinarum TaxID=1912324 RepID=UPI00214B0C64|nr:hypothetical protein [Haloplanus salinarum]